MADTNPTNAGNAAQGKREIGMTPPKNEGRVIPIIDIDALADAPLPSLESLQQGISQSTPKPPAPAPEPIPQPEREEEEKPEPGKAFQSDLPRIRTYADDLSEEIRKKGATLSSIVGAERERSARELALGDDGPPTIKKGEQRKGLLLFSGMVLFVVLGIGIVGAAFFFSSQQSTDTQKVSIIFANKSIAAPTYSERSFTDALAGIRNNAKLSLGEIAELDITVDSATTTVQQVLQKLNAPSSLIREARSGMIGIHSFNYYQPFIIVEITQYDRAFGAMLDWEEEMGRSFGAFFRPLNGGVAPTTLFKDAVYKNIDLRKSQESWPILYAFPRRDILVITTNESTLQEIVTRLNAQSAPVR